jgi:hypothetical protein
LIDILVIAICTLLCGGESFNDMEDFGHAKQDWFKTFLSLRHGIPSHDTFNRLLAALDPEKFLDAFLGWTQSLRQAVPQEIVALDGKALRRALNQDQSVKYVVSAWAREQSSGVGPAQSGRPEQRDHGRAVVAAGSGVERLHCDARGDGLSEKDRAGNHRGGRRLCVGAQGQSGNGARGGQKLSRSEGG